MTCGDTFFPLRNLLVFYLQSPFEVNFNILDPFHQEDLILVLALPVYFLVFFDGGKSDLFYICSVDQSEGVVVVEIYLEDIVLVYPDYLGRPRLAFGAFGED